MCSSSNSAIAASFHVIRQFARPTTMDNLANEGIAIAPESQCTNGSKAFFWIDDA